MKIKAENKKDKKIAKPLKSKTADVVEKKNIKSKNVS